MQQRRNGGAAGFAECAHRTSCIASRLSRK
jgi:hypothetical protein